MSGARIVTVVNAKGGCGKTTTSMMLGGYLARQGSRVLVVDADPTSGALGWASAADDERPFPATVVSLAAAEGKIHIEVRKFLSNYDYIVIDCPPAAKSLTPRAALLISDLAVIPMIPSPVDIRQSTEIRAVISEVQVNNESLVPRILVNGLAENRRLDRDSREMLGEFGIPLLKTHLGQRIVFRQSALFGETVFEYKPRDEKAIAEVESLGREVLSLLEGEGDAAREAEA